MGNFSYYRPPLSCPLRPGHFHYALSISNSNSQSPAGSTPCLCALSPVYILSTTLVLSLTAARCRLSISATGANRRLCQLRSVYVHFHYTFCLKPFGSVYVKYKIIRAMSTNSLFLPHKVMYHIEHLASAM